MTWNFDKYNFSKVLQFIDTSQRFMPQKTFRFDYKKTFPKKIFEKVCNLRIVEK